MLDSSTVSLYSPNGRHLPCTRRLSVASEKCWKFPFITWVYDPLWLGQSQSLYRPAIDNTNITRLGLCKSLAIRRHCCALSHGQPCQHEGQWLWHAFAQLVSGMVQWPWSHGPRSGQAIVRSVSISMSAVFLNPYSISPEYHWLNARLWYLHCITIC